MSFRPHRPVTGSNETRVQTSIRLANTRVNKALQSLTMVSNLASPRYELTRGQWDQIFAALDQALAGVKKKVKDHLSPKVKPKQEVEVFTLPDPPQPPPGWVKDIGWTKE